MNRVWECKIGFADSAELPGGADEPMRLAVERAFKDLIGRPSSFTFSGRVGTLTEAEMDVVMGQAGRPAALPRYVRKRQVMGFPASWEVSDDGKDFRTATDVEAEALRGLPTVLE